MNKLITKLHCCIYVFTLSLLNIPSGNAVDRFETYNASTLEWTLTGYIPNSMAVGLFPSPPFGPMKVKVPGSVQNALLENKLIKDWNYGMNSLDCEWIENRQWVFKTMLPNEWFRGNNKFRVGFKGLDDNGKVFLNAKLIGTFDNAFIPYTFDLSNALKPMDNELMIVFDLPPRNLAQVHYTSKIKDFKPRFYYSWDWAKRVVQMGVWDDVFVESVPQIDFSEIEYLKVLPTASKDKDEGSLYLQATFKDSFFSKNKVRVQLKDTKGKVFFDKKYPSVDIKRGIEFKNLKIERWYPNGWGKQPLYTITCSMLDKDDNEIQTVEKTIGFKHLEWLSCKGAAIDSDPWICSVNNNPIFLQGVNWTPIRPNFADLTKSDYEKLLSTYKRLGLNTIRVWGGAFAEKDWLYDLCDQYGIMIWQDFPMSSSALDNYPPTDAAVIQEMAKTVRVYVKRLRSHVSIIQWCGGNELMELGDVSPVTNKHPMINSLYEIVATEDPTRRFIPGSPSGPSIWGGRSNFGKGINWETHGPWKIPYDEANKDYSIESVRDYWRKNDVLMNSEVGVGGASSVELLEKYSGGFNPFPASFDNILWRQQYSFWTDWDDYLREHSNSEPKDLTTYVNWSQKRQAETLAIALEYTKNRFPNSGGFLIWMGHDCFPVTANSSIIDFEGNLKPAAESVSKIWLQKQNKY